MKKLVKGLVIFFLVIFISICLINIIVIGKSSKYINSDDINYSDYKYVIVLGASVVNDSPSLMLKDRLDKALEIYNENNNIKIILSGDSVSSDNYDEVGVMYKYLINNNVNNDNIILDNYGISSYDSIVRMKKIVKKDKVIIVTQKYHLYRSVYIALSNDIDAIGSPSFGDKYFGQFIRDIREILARVKDYIFVKLKVKSKY